MVKRWTRAQSGTWGQSPLLLGNYLHQGMASMQIREGTQGAKTEQDLCGHQRASGLALGPNSVTLPQIGVTPVGETWGTGAAWLLVPSRILSNMLNQKWKIFLICARFSPQKHTQQTNKQTKYPIWRSLCLHFLVVEWHFASLKFNTCPEPKVTRILERGNPYATVKFL